MFSQIYLISLSPSYTHYRMHTYVSRFSKLFYFLSFTFFHSLHFLCNRGPFGGLEQKKAFIMNKSMSMWQKSKTPFPGAVDTLLKTSLPCHPQTYTHTYARTLSLPRPSSIDSLPCSDRTGHLWVSAQVQKTIMIAAIKKTIIPEK